MNAKHFLIVICMLGLFVSGCSPANDQEAEQILSGAAETTVAGVTIVPVTPVATLDVNVIVTQTFAALTAQAATQKSAATPPAPTATQASSVPAITQPAATSTTGSISGKLIYPSSSIPAMHVAAYLYGTESYIVITTTAGQSSYEIDGLNPGIYWVIAYTIGGGGFPDSLPGGYTKAVPCGLSANCTDHTLIDVIVAAGHITPNVSPEDWYAPQGTFMPLPHLGP
jgi:hypothetical protein